MSESDVKKEYVRRSRGPGALEGIRPHFQDFHRLTMSGDYEYPVHRHREYELIWVERGVYRCSLNGHDLDVVPGGFLVIKPGDLHQDHLRTGQRHYVLHFTLSHRLFADDTAALSQIGESSLRDVGPIFRDMEQEASRSDRFSGSLQDALLETLFWRIVRLLPSEALSRQFKAYSQRQDFVVALYALFDQVMRDPITAEEMAVELGMSKRTLSLRCREFLNDSPARLLLRHRIERARELLAFSERSVKEVSFELGFDSQFGFSRAFKRIVGSSPTRYRAGG